MRKTILLTLLLCISAHAINAQNKEIDKLSFKLGKWKWKTKGLTKSGDPKMYNGEGYSNIYYVNDSNAIIDEHKIDWEDGTIYKAITYRTFDEASKSYMVVWAQANTSNTSKIKGHWEGEKFVEIEDKKLSLYIIQPSVPIEIVYDIFNRINTLGTPLNKQEVRNCLFTGKATHFLFDMVNRSIFKQAIDEGISDKRMKARETILRFVAFYTFDYKDRYAGQMSNFLDLAMQELNLMTKERLKEIEEI